MKWIRRILVGMLLIIVCAGGFVAGKGYRMYQEALEEKSLVQIRKETVEDENFVSAEEARLLNRWQKISILTWIKQLSGRLPRYLWQLRWKKNLQKRRF